MIVSVLQQDRAELTPGGGGEFGGCGGGPADPEDELWVLRDVEYLSLEHLPGDLDLEGLAEWCGGQPELGRGEQDRAGGLSGAEPIELVVTRRSDDQQLRSVTGWIMPERVAGLAELAGREVAQRGRTDRGRGHVAGGDAIAAPGVAAGPQLQLGRVAGSVRLDACGFGEGSGEPLSHGRAGYREEDRADAGCLLRESPEMACGHRAVAHPAPLGPPPVDTREQRRVGGIPGARPDGDDGEVARILRIRQPVHLRSQAPGGEGDLQVMQGGAAAQDEVTAVGVGRGQVPGPDSAVVWI